MSSNENQQQGNSNLYKQDLSQLDINKLTPLSPEVISRQATINIGTIGHVAHGKSTVVKAISGVQTVRFKNELERNITIKLERVPYEKLLTIANSPTKLSQLIKDVEAVTGEAEAKRMSSNNNRTAKRKLSESSTISPPNPLKKQRKIMDFFKISPHKGVTVSSTVLSSPSPPPVAVTIDLSNDNDRPVRYTNGSRRLSSASSVSTKSETSEKSAKPRKSDAQKSKVSAFNPEKEFEVEAILDLGVIRSNPRFFIKWKGWDDDANTWEPLSAVARLEIFEKFITTKFEEERELVKTTQAKVLEYLAELPDLRSSIIPADNISDHEMIETIEKIDYISVYVDMLLLSLDVKDNHKFKSNSKIVSRIAKYAHILDHIYKRQRQKASLKEWEVYINSKGINLNMIVENEFDFEGPPTNFTYINEYLPSAGVTLPEDPPIGCSCESDCSYQTRASCCAELSGGKFAYNSKKRIKIAPGMPIYECNKTCSCGPECLNRVVQNGQKRSLCIFKTQNGRGWGVKTNKTIYKGQYICQYVGEIVTAEEAEYRGKIYDAEGRTYLFDLDINADSETQALYTIDAAKYGNISHFINHSCEPNAAVWTVWINCLDPDLPSIAFFALSDISPGEEITFDYLNHFNEKENRSELMESMVCKCGADNCRKFLF